LEFFGLADIKTNEARLQQCLRLERLPGFCSGIRPLAKHMSELEGEVCCMWGHFALRKENINGGVRFTLPACSFRVPARWLFFAHLSLVVLGGMGMNWMLVRENSDKLKLPLKALLVVLAGLALGALFGRAGHRHAREASRSGSVGKGEHLS